MESLIVILQVAVGIGMVIFVHELGHFLVAKWAGVKVERFSIGWPLPKGGPNAVWVCALIALGIWLFALTKGSETFSLTTGLIWGLGGAAVGLLVWLIGGRVLRLYTDKDGTDYVLSPLLIVGGYVKMLGENPEERTEEIAHDPRSFAAKSVWRRMAIISAGVVMNVLFAGVLFVFAFGMGVHAAPAFVSSTAPGLPAWEAAIPPGSQIVEIDGLRNPTFMDVRRRVARSEGDVHLAIRELPPDQPIPEDYERQDDLPGDERRIVLTPTTEGQLLPAIGLEEPAGTRLNDGDDRDAWLLPGSPAASADPPFEGGDRIVAIANLRGGEAVDPVVIPNGRHDILHRQLTRRAAETLRITVERRQGGEAEDVPIRVAPNYFRSLGFTLQMGRIRGIQQGSPAAAAAPVQEDPAATTPEVEPGLRPGDVIVAVNGDRSPETLDPLRFGDLMAGYADRGVRLTVQRERQEGQAMELSFALEPRDEPGWSQLPSGDSPMPCPALGIVYDIVSKVQSVEPGSAAAQAGLRAGSETDPVLINSVRFVLPGDHAEADDIDVDPIRFSEESRPWPAVFWRLQTMPEEVQLELSFGSGDDPVRFRPQRDRSWPLWARGITLARLTITRTETPLAAVPAGIESTWDAILDVYTVIRGLITGRISPEAIGGPVTIFRVTAAQAERGFSDLLMILGMLSVNLAVLNFLPIPILDGGHMVFLVWEAIRGKPASERALGFANLIGLAVILSLMVLVLYLDFFVHM